MSEDTSAAIVYGVPIEQRDSVSLPWMSDECKYKGDAFLWWYSISGEAIPFRIYEYGNNNYLISPESDDFYKADDDEAVEIDASFLFALEPSIEYLDFLKAHIPNFRKPQWFLINSL